MNAFVRSIIFLVTLSIWLILPGCSRVVQHPSITISGTISNAPPHTLYIYRTYLDGRAETLIDSVLVNKLDQPFHMRIPFNHDSNSILKLNIGRNAMFVYLDDTVSKVSLKVNLNDIGHYSISGTAADELFQQLNQLERPFLDSLYILTNFANNAKNKSDQADFIAHAIRLRKQLQLTWKSVADTCQNPKVVLKITNDLDFSKDLSQYKEFVTSLDSRFNNHSGIKKYVRESTQFIRILEYEFKPGDTIPDFKLKVLGQDPVLLSQLLKVKNLLLFWTSYCNTCYDQFHVMNDKMKTIDTAAFQCIGMSLDIDSLSWLTAVKELNCNCLKVYDFQGWQGAIAGNFLIDSIPYRMLIDKRRKVLPLDEFK